MRSPRSRRFLLLGFACGLGAVAAGCDAGAAVESGPRTAAIRTRPIMSPAEASGEPERPVPEPVEPDPARDPNAERPAAVEAARPAAKPTVTLTSAERPASRPIESLRSSPSPAVDPSRFPGGIVPASPNAEPLPGGPRLLVPERTFRAEGRPRALRVSYDDLDLLRVLNQGDPIPADIVDRFPGWLRELDGKTIRLRGFMYPAFEQELSTFILTRDTGECCFGPFPKPYYLIPVKLKEGTKASYVQNRPIDVTGTFKIAPVIVDGTWVRIYRISDATVDR